MISDVMRSDTPVMESIEINLSGRLQGVGLRPFLWRLARRLDIRGSTCNTPTGVRIIAQGSRESILDFQEHLISNPP
jgi:hydrogenase maturation protein HypF